MRPWIIFHVFENDLNFSRFLRKLKFDVSDTGGIIGCVIVSSVVKDPGRLDDAMFI